MTTRFDRPRLELLIATMRLDNSAESKIIRGLAAECIMLMEERDLARRSLILLSEQFDKIYRDGDAVKTPRM